MKDEDERRGLSRSDQPDSDRDEAGVFFSAGFRRDLQLSQLPELGIKDGKLSCRYLGVDELGPTGLRVGINGKDFTLGSLNRFGD
jgi:hypothetical protein